MTSTVTSTPSTPDDFYDNAMQIAWKFSYDVSDRRLEALYRRAKKNQWDSDELLDWDQTVDSSRPLVNEAQNTYCRMPFYQRLSKSQQEKFNAHSTAQLLSQFLHGEQGALMTAAAVSHSVPDASAKLYAATQTMDEARHVEVYAKYVDKVAIVYPMSPMLKSLIDATLQSGRFEKIMIGMNMVVEGLALGAFNNMYRQTTCPLLRDITFNVMRDEARHVSFGHTYLGPLIAKMHPDDVEDLAQFAFDAINVIVQSQRTGGGHGTAADRTDPGFVEVLKTCDIEPEDFFDGLEEAAELGITMDLPPGQVHSLKQLMMPAMARVGLITPRTEELFDEVGIRVNRDLSVLNAMEDAKSDQNILNEAGVSY
ncbi:MAG: ferritin-like domain-containing protein [Rhodospirillaceae bacterium]|nr:ferritin-like domain-containing protein [Rhodospirillaceae bacterium]MBT5897747.1 ferritin-like domain-containing protein [Rhodospirillaceae bacterium]MBT6429013.1 ferritin-like domain-containing protein [Rhodospirillaceae bacterium]